MTRVLVIGAGVVGLTCAVRLAEAGYDVSVFARDLPPETTSTVAAALWYPYLAEPKDRVLGWAATSFTTFETLARTEPDAGVRMRWGTELLTEPSPADPWWASAVKRLDRLTPPDGYADGWRFAAPVADMDVYLAWLTKRLAELGGTLNRQAMHALPNQAPIVVNCSGLGARHLAADQSLTPVRGQVCLVEQVGLTEWWLDEGDEENLCYIVPRLDTIVVGGTAEDGVWDRTPRPEVATRLLSKAEQLVPALAGARVVAHRVGLRPKRPTVRLEPETFDDGRLVVHCYGHGGAGMTLSWGCADEVRALVDDLHA